MNYFRNQGYSNQGPPNQGFGNQIGKFGNQMYDGAATIGHIKAYITLFIVIVVGLIISWFSYKMISKNQDHLVDANGKVINSDCDSRTVEYWVGKDANREKKSRMVYDCEFDVEFKVGVSPYSGPFSTIGGSNVVVNQPYDVTYNKSDPTKFTAKIIRSKTIGYIALGIGLLIVLSGVGYFVIMIMFKPMAALSGAKSVKDYIT
jgi:hypothetical protein